MRKIIILLIIPLFVACKYHSSRQTISLSGEGWNVWMDTAAKWQNDSLYLPGEFFDEVLQIQFMIIWNNQHQDKVLL